MNDRAEDRHQEVMNALGELHKQQLLLILHRLEKLELHNGTANLKRLSSMKSVAEREAVAIDISERLSVLEAQLEGER